MRKIAPRFATMLDRLGERVELASGFDRSADRSRHGAFDEHRRHQGSASSTTSSPAANPRRDRWLAEFDDTDGAYPGAAPAFAQSSGAEEQLVQRPNKICTGDDDEKTYVLCRSEQRIARIAAIPRKTTRPLARRRY